MVQPNVASTQTRRATSSGVPHGSDDGRAAFGIARVVDLVPRATEQDAAHLGAYARSTIERAGKRCSRDSLERGLNLLDEEQRRIAPVERPPCPDRFEMPLGGFCNDDPEGRHEPRRRRSAVTSAAERTRPARTSSSELARAACRRSRSSSSRSSHESAAISSTSAPSGRSVGSSTTKRPPRTCPFKRIMTARVSRPLVYPQGAE